MFSVNIERQLTAAACVLFFFDDYSCHTTEWAMVDRCKPAAVIDVCTSGVRVTWCVHNGHSKSALLRFVTHWYALF